MSTVIKSLIFAFLFFIFIPSNSAWAETFEQSVERGKTAFESNNYSVAIDAFSAAYTTRPTAGLLYNIGRSYDGIGDLKNAEIYYNRFVNSPGIGQDARADAMGRLKTVREVIAMNAADLKKKEAETKPKEVKVKAPPVKNLPKEEKIESNSASPLAWVFLGLGVVSIGGGIVTGIVSQNKFEEIELLGYPDLIRDEDVEELRSLQDSGNDLKISSIVLVSAGALLATGGIITYFVTSSKPEKPTAGLKIHPILSPTLQSFPNFQGL